nr:MAG TPA: hypothetical protein [Caudoviricetes sp.]
MQTSQSRERVKGQCPLGGEEPRAFLPFSSAPGKSNN